MVSVEGSGIRNWGSGFRVTKKLPNWRFRKSIYPGWHPALAPKSGQSAVQRMKEGRVSERERPRGTSERVHYRNRKREGERERERERERGGDNKRQREKINERVRRLTRCSSGFAWRCRGATLIWVTGLMDSS